MRFYRSLELDSNPILEKVKFARNKWRPNNAYNPGTFINKYIEHKNKFDDEYFRRLHVYEFNNKRNFFRQILTSKNAWIR